jgi:beta-galactosidase
MREPNISLNENWRFCLEDVAGAEQTAFDDAAWETLDLPHTWNNRDGQNGGGNYYRGIGWYRKSFRIDSAHAGKRFYLQFDGANIVADVTLNGQHMGQHRGGYAAFRFDATPHTKAGEENVLAVKVDNSYHEDVPPLSGDWTFFGGIYRDVHLVVVDPLHVDLMDHGSPGIYLTQTEVSATSARLEVRSRIVNDAPESVLATITATILDAKGLAADVLTESVKIEARSSADFCRATVIATPHLWQGRQDPYLYTVKVEVSGENGYSDSVEQPLGFRSFRVDANEGFYLNGQYLDLHGVCRHQDRLDMGNAIGEKEMGEDLALIMEMGATAVRLAHYQHADTFYGLCDASGLVVWAELALVNQVSESDAFYESAKQQLVELIRQNYNHPSIVFWSVFNEITMGARRGRGVADPNRLIAQLHELAKAEDPTRLTTGAAIAEADNRVVQHTDVIAFNRYFGWYWGEFTDFAEGVDDIHTQYPDLRFGIGEYGAGASINIHSDAPVRQDHSQEYQCLYHEAHWKAIAQRPFIWGTFVWNMFDFASDRRNEGDTPGRNDKGLVTYDRKVRKDAYYWYKANWSNEPVLHITSKRFAERTSGHTQVKVYANLDSVEIKVNGKSLGVKTSDDCIFAWTDVPLALGENQVEAIGTRDGAPYTDSVTCTDSVTWTRLKNPDATVRSDTVGIVEHKSQIVNLPYGTTAATLSQVVTPAADATYEVHAPDGTFAGGVLGEGMELVVTAQDGEHRKAYTFVHGALSQGKPARASTHFRGGMMNMPAMPPANANDGNRSTMWSAGFGRLPQWWQVDLGAVFYLSEIACEWPVRPDPDRPGAFQYCIEISCDGKQFQTVVDATGNKTPKQTTHTLATPGRHVRVTITNTSVTRKVRMMDREMPIVAISQVDVQGGLIYTDAYRIDYEDKTIAGVPSGTLAKQFSAQLQPVEGATICVYRPNEDAEVTSGTIEPSMSVVVTANDGIQRECYTLDIEP